MIYSKQRAFLDLNGEWKFCMDPNGIKSDDITAESSSVAWRPVDIPCDIAHACPEQPDYIGPCWFRKKFDMPENMRGKRVVIRFEAVNYIAAVFLNGKFIGRSIHGFLPFEFDITKHILSDSPNILLVMTDHRRKYGEIPTYFGWKNAGGIIRDVLIYITDETYIERARIQTELSGETNITVDITGSISPDMQLKIELIESSTGKQKAEGIYNAQKNQTIKFWPDKIEFWSPEIPNLYICKLSLAGKNTYDCVETVYGYRRLEVKNGQFYLNGAPYFLKGYNYHEDNCKTGGAVCREIQESDLRVMKESGANFIRSHYPHDRRVMELADELGFIWMAEIPLNALFLHGFSVPAGANANEARLNQAFHNAKEMLSMLLERDWNHPCVCFWSVSNESNELEIRVNDINDALLQYVKALDPGRLCAHVSMGGMFTQENIDRIYRYDDVICVNCYPIIGKRQHARDFGRDLSGVRQSWRDTIEWIKSHYLEKPVIVTEFGYVTDRPYDGIISEDIQCECIEAEYKIIREYAQGAALWVYADHPWPPEIVSEGYDLSTYGLFRRDRTPKKAYEVYKKLLREEN